MNQASLSSENTNQSASVNTNPNEPQVTENLSNGQRFDGFMRGVIDLSKRHNVCLEYLESFYAYLNTSNTRPNNSMPVDSLEERHFKGQTCQACKEAHSGCDKMRPCSRCVRIKISCVDPIPKRRGRPPTERK